MGTIAKVKAAVKVADKVARNLPKVAKGIDNAVAAHAYNKASKAAKSYQTAKNAYYKTDDKKQPVTAKIRQKQAMLANKNMEKKIDDYFKVGGKVTRNMMIGNSGKLANASKKTAKNNLSSGVLSKKKKK